MNRKHHAGIILLLLLAAGLYVNTLGNLFTNWDDGMIYANPQIRSLGWENLVRIFSYERAATYQPIRVLSYAIDYRLWKLNPFGYHITNIVFYGLTCLFVFLALQELARQLPENKGGGSPFRLALFGSLLFAAHPVHVEAVAWLAARKEVLQGTFFFMALWLYLKARRQEERRRILLFAGVLFAFLLAVLSKPSAIVFPAVLVLYEFTLAKDQWFGLLRKRWPFFLGLIGVSAVFCFILFRVMVDAGGIKPLRGGNLVGNLLISCYALLYNIKLLVYPINYSAAYTLALPENLWSLPTAWVILAVVLLLGASALSLKKSRIVFFATGFFLITLLPYLNIIPISTLLADRYVFIASFAYCFLLGAGFDKLYAFQHRRFSKNYFRLISISVSCLMVIGYGLITVAQNRVWENSYTLWMDAVEKHPESNTANALLGVVYMELGMDEKAMTHLEKAVSILPYDYQSRNNLAVIYGRTGMPEKARKEFMTALWLKPDSENIRINLSVFYAREREFDKAEEILKDLLTRKPGNAMLYYRLGTLYKGKGDWEKALQSFRKASELAPHILNPYEEMGNVYLRIGKPEEAIEWYRKGIENVPQAKGRVEDLRWMIQDLQSRR